MDTTEQKNTKVLIGTNVDPAIYDLVVEMAQEEERSLSNTVERLLKTHPRVAERLVAETTGAAA